MEEKAELERQLDELRKELNKVNELRNKEKTKIDSVIIFCKLIDSCSFSKLEILDRLAELPSIISAYLKGEIDDFTFNKYYCCNQTLTVIAKILLGAN